MTVDDVQFEVKNQVGGSSYFIITDKKGNPIQTQKVQEVYPYFRLFKVFKVVAIKLYLPFLKHIKTMKRKLTSLCS